MIEMVDIIKPELYRTSHVMLKRKTATQLGVVLKSADLDVYGRRL